MGGMYQTKDLLLLAAKENAEELLLEPDQPPRMRLRGAVRVLDGPLLTSDEVEGLLRSISTEEQLRELELCGDAHFPYAAEHLAQFNVHAHMQGSRIHVIIKHVSSS